MNVTFDLLIIDILGNYNVVKDVYEWGLHTDDVFYFVKNRRRSFIPAANVFFIGRKSDWCNEV